MKCSNKSIRWSAEALAASALCLALAPEARARSFSDTCVPGVSRAMVAALKLRMSGAVEFQLRDVSCALDASAGDVVATPAPGARIGRPIRFAIARLAARPTAGTVRVGEASAIVSAVGTVVRTTREVPRAAILAVGDIVQAEASLEGLPLRPVLTPADVVGARVTRPLGAGQVLDDASIVPVPAIRSGDRVRAILRMPDLEVETIVVATDSGAVNQVIRVVNPETRRAMRARVRGKGVVEIEVRNER